MARAEGGLVPSGVGYGEGCPLFSRLGGVEERAENGFWRILKAPKRSFLYLYDKICGGQFALSSPTTNSGGVSLCPPP